MKFNSILIVSYGRTGSTLLQGILNTIDNVDIRGENNNFLYGFFEAYKRLSATIDNYGSIAKEPVHSWYGADKLSKDQFIEQTRLFIKKIFNFDNTDNKVYGFKEIRYFENNNFEEYLDFLCLVLDNPCIIFNTRAINEVCKSGWWRFQNEEIVKEKLLSYNNKINAYHSKKPYTSFIIDYSEFTVISTKLLQLYEFIGASFNKDKVCNILAKSHSSDNKIKANYSLFIGQPDNIVEIINIDDNSIPVSLENNNYMDLNGVVILANSSGNFYSLKAKDISGTHEVKWGIKSPLFFTKYPNNPKASNARFQIKNLIFSNDTPIELFLIDADGNSRLLVKIGNSL
jgi:hypothetical protein